MRDLNELRQHISLDSPDNAKNFIRKLRQATEELIGFPERGRMVPEFENPAIRELLFGNYRVIYRLTEERIEVVRVRHSQQLLSARELRN